jgi:hypothetical protein
VFLSKLCTLHVVVYVCPFYDRGVRWTTVERFTLSTWRPFNPANHVRYKGATKPSCVFATCTWYRLHISPLPNCLVVCNSLEVNTLELVFIIIMVVDIFMYIHSMYMCIYISLYICPYVSRFSQYMYVGT